MIFYKNDIVKWSHHVGKRIFFYQGKILAVVPPNKDPAFFIPKRIRKNIYLYRYTWGLSRKYESYIIEITGKIHWPIVSRLELALPPPAEFTAVFSKGKLQYLETPKGKILNKNPRYKKRG